MATRRTVRSKGGTRRMPQRVLEGSTGQPEDPNMWERRAMIFAALMVNPRPQQNPSRTIVLSHR
jgi:hypothetical protein